MRGFEPEAPIQTERLVLRRFEDDDLPALAAMYGDAEVNRWLYTKPLTWEEARSALRARQERAAIGAAGGAVSLAAVVRATGELAGDFSLGVESVEHLQGEIGFVVHPDHQGRGYATEAARALLGVAFRLIGLHRVVGRLEVRNAASARVLEKLGMRREAHFVENEWVKGEWQSEAVYAILAREWDAAVGN